MYYHERASNLTLLPHSKVRESNKLHAPILKKRGEVLKKIDGFWAQALMNMMTIHIYLENADIEALAYLTDFSIERTGEDGDPRPAKFNFTFAKNPYFSDTTLTKEFKLRSDAPSLKADYDYIQEVVPVKTQINWIDDEHNLAKKNPQKGGQEDDDFEPGSFFSCFFESEKMEVAGPIAMGLQDDFYPNAVEAYTGKYDGSVESEEED